MQCSRLPILYSILAQKVSHFRIIYCCIAWWFSHNITRAFFENLDSQGRKLSGKESFCGFCGVTECKENRSILQISRPWDLCWKEWVIYQPRKLPFRFGKAWFRCQRRPRSSLGFTLEVGGVPNGSFWLYFVASFYSPKIKEYFSKYVVAKWKWNSEILPLENVRKC